MASFVDDEGTLRILLAVPNRVNGTSMYSIDRFGRFIEEANSINTQFVSSMSIWRLELDWEWQLAIANQPTYEPLIGNGPRQSLRRPLPEPKPMISIYSWRSTYFDSYQLIHLPYDGRVNKLEPMHINGQEFLILAMEANRLEGPPGGRNQQPLVDSLIYKLHFGDGTLNWLHFQALGTRLALDVRFFEITHEGSVQKDYYIALLGQTSKPIQDSNVRDDYSAARINSTSSIAEYGLMIYKYLGDRFMIVQSILATDATKLDTLAYGAGNSYTIIALLSEWSNQVNLFMYDGLMLKPIPGPFVSRAPPARWQGHRAKRMRDVASLHLFTVPPQEALNESVAKRTLKLDAQETLAYPVLALSRNDLEDFESTETNHSTSNSFFQIPVSELVEQTLEQSAQDGNYSKRDNVNPNLDLLSWCQSTLVSLMADNFDLSAKQLLSLPRYDQQRPIELHSDLIIENDLYVSNLIYASRVEEQNSTQNVIIQSVPSNFSPTFDLIQRTQLEIDSVKQVVDEILVDDGSNQDIFSPLSFETLVIDCYNPANFDPRFIGFSCPRVDELLTSTLNSHNISDIQQRALLTGRSMRVVQDVRFEHLVLRGSVQILDTLNGLPVNNIVFKQGPHLAPIVGHKNLMSGLYSSCNLLVHDWNGAAVNRDNFLVSSGEQRIEAALKFNRVVLKSNNVYNTSHRFETLNGLHLDSHLDDMAISDASNNFEVKLHFEELVLNGEVMLPPVSFLSGLNIEDLWHNAMFKKLNQQVLAPMEFLGDVYVSYGGHIHVDGPINGLRLDPAHVVMRNRDHIIPYPVIFDHDVEIRDLRLGVGLNGIQVAIGASGMPQLAILYDGDDQELTADKVFTDIHLGGHSVIGGTINGHLNLTQLYDLANNNLREPYRFSTVRLFGTDIRVADGVRIHIDSTINTVPTNDLCMVALRAAESSNASYNRLRFEGPTHFRSLRCASINGFNNLATSFLTRHTDQRVAGTLHLVNGAIFNTSVNIRSTFNNLDIGPLSNAMAKLAEETRTIGRNEHRGPLVVDELIVERLNDLRLSDVFLAKADSPQIVRAPLSFDHLDIENVLIVGDNLVTNSFNGLNLTDVFTNTLQYDTPQTIYNHVELNMLQILPGSNFITPSLNGQNLRNLYADAVLVDAPQQILGPKVFRGPVDFTDRVFVRHGIDGLSNEELRFNLLLHSDEVIDDDLEFNNDVIVRKDLDILSRTINDIDIDQFVNSMLFERRPGGKGLRVEGNGSVTFRDVQVNNLVVAGTIQGIDLSREALTKGDNINGSYDAEIRRQQALNNNLQLINSFYGPGSSFKVSSRYRSLNYTGHCFVHSCHRSPILNPLETHKLHNNNYQRPPLAPPPLPEYLPYPQPQSYYRQRPNFTVANMPINYYKSPFNFVQHFYLPRPMSVTNFNATNFKTVWQPKWTTVQQFPLVNLSGMAHNYTIVQEQSPYVEHGFIQHQILLRTQAIKELATRINKYLSVSLYYEIVQKHPHLGPLLNAAVNPIRNEQGSAFLLLKATSKPGEPCLRRGQTIAVMAQQRQRRELGAFTLSSRIQETSDPLLVESVVVGENHYLFILDSYSEESPESTSQVLIYLWNYNSGMYDLLGRIVVDGFPTAMRAFSILGRACFVLANPRVLQGNYSGSPNLHCQDPDFNQKIILPIANVFDLDIETIPGSAEILIAALSQHDSEQIGDLTVINFDVAAKLSHRVAVRRLVKPLKVHFFRDFPSSPKIRLVVSEAITSNDNAQAITRIFTIRLRPPNTIGFRTNPSAFYESQALKDNQFNDIQSARLDSLHSLLFLQSTYSISIYAPSASLEPANSDCDITYSLVQRLPTKGANKFLVFNEQLVASNRSDTGGVLGHFLVLSRDDCEQQQHTTLILRAKLV